MPRIVEIPGVAELSFPDDLSEDEMLVQTRKFYEQSKQGALPAAGNALMQQGGRMVGGGMMGLTRVGLEEPPPIMSAAQVESPAGMAAYERRRAAWEKRVKEVSPEETMARAAMLEAGPTFQMGKALQQGAEEAFPVNPLRQDDYLTQIASGIGSLPVSVVPGVGQLAYGFSAGEDAAQKTGKFYDAQIAQALAEGNIAEVNRLQAEKPVKQYQSALYTAPIGALTEFGIGAVPAFGRAVAGQVNKSIFKEAARTALEEGAQEVSEQWLGNAVAKKTYNPDQKLTEGLFESGAAGSGVGALVGLIGGKAGRVASNQRLAQELNAPLSEAQIQEIINRQAAGRAAIGGDPSNPLPNATATLAGINAGGAPSGPINIVPPGGNVVTVGANAVTPEEVSVIPDIALETDVADEEIATAVAPETIAASETSVSTTPVTPAAATEVQPLTIEETQEFLAMVEAIGEGSTLDVLTAEEAVRFEGFVSRARQLQQAGFEFDETNGWIKPVAAETPAAPQEPTPFRVAPDFRYTITEAPNYGFSPLLYEDADFELERLQTQAERGRLTAEGFAQSEIGMRMNSGQMSGVNIGLRSDPVGTIVALRAALVPAPAATPAATPTPAARETSRTFLLQNRKVDGMIERDTGGIVEFAKSIVGTPKERGSQPKYTIKIDQDVTIDAQSEAALDKALQRIAPGAPVRVFRNAGKGVTLDFNKPGPVTPTPAPTPAAAPTPTPAATPAIANQTVGNGKYAALLVKDLFAQQPDYAMWLVRSTRSATPGSRQRQVGDYINSLPEYQNAVTEERAKAEAILTDENQTFLAGLKINARQNPDGSITLRGKTYDRKEELTNAGGRYSQTGNDKFYTISATGLGQFIERSRADSGAAGGQRSSGPAYSRDAELRKLREDADNRPDRSGLEGGVDNYLGVETQELIRQGEEFGIPREVGDEQIEDAALMVQAFATDRPFFMLSSAPGTGKTFVLGAGIREMKDRFARKIIYVTLNRGLIKQIQQDLKAYNIGDVKFITYSEMKDLPVEESDVIIFDEAHAIKNLAGSGSEQAKKAQEWILKTKFPIFSTATPFENPTQTAYLLNTGIFDSFNGDYKQFAAAYGATPIKGEGGQVVRTVWLPTKTNEQDQIAARNFFRKEGIFTARKTRLPAEQVDSRLVPIKGDEEWTNTYNAFAAEAEAQKSSLDGTEKMWIINYKKRLLEASKIKNAISEARRALSAERWPIIFVETKAERSIDIQEQLRLQEQFKRAKAIADRTGGDRPKRSDYKGLLSDGIINVLEATMQRIGTTVISIPSAEDVIKNEIGANDVAIFTGSVPDNRAQRNLDLWRGPRPMVLVATMAKGGTGLSLHDKTGAHPTTQINVNLPWTASQVEQVSLRSARYGLRGKAQMMWLFADNIPFERELATRVGGRMRDMGALVQGEVGATATNIKNFNFEDESFSEANAAEAAKKDLTKEEPKVTPPAAPVVTAPPTTPAVAAPKKGRKAREWAFKGDILDDIINLGGVMSKSQAKKDKRLDKIQSLYDDAPRLDPYFNKIFAGRKRGEGSRNQPDVLLQELATENPGKYGDMTVAEFWAEVEKAARGRKGDVAAAKEETKAAAAGAKEAMGLDAFLQAQDDAFVDAQTEGMQNAGEPDGPIQISVGSLALGDKFSVQGEQFEVTVVTPDGGYTIRDGDKFGVQQLTEYDTLFVDEPPDSGGGDAFEFPTEGPAPTERKPRLAAGQNQGDLISSTQVEDFALVGEKGVDLEARKQKAQAAARAAAEAKAAQEKAQMNLFGESPIQQAGKAAIDAIDQINKSIDENQYSDPLFLTPLAKLALQIAKSLIRAGMAVDRAVRQAIAQARESYPNEAASDKSLESAMLQAADINDAVGQIAPNDGEQAQGFVEPKKTVRAYKLFRTLKTKPGKLFPLFIGKNESVPVGEWIPAKFIPTQGFAERPGWHAGILPNAPHLLRKDGTMPSDRVWAEVEIPADVDWQSRADSTATGDIQSEVPAGGNYKFKRPGLQGGSWIIGGALKVNRILSQPEVDKIMRDSGASKAAPVGEMSDAVAEVSDAIAQFVESITPKAGITEGPTPEDSARRVLETLTNLASKAILSGIQSASRWATSLQMKLSPALQYAWDRAQGSTVEPTPEVIADVATLPERANSSDFGVIYSTPGKPVTTKRGAYEDTVAGRRSRTPEVVNAGIQLAVDAFNEAGVKFRQVGDTLFAPVDGVDQEAAGRKLIEVAKKKIAKAKADGRSDTIAELIQSLRNHFGASEAFSPDTRDELYLIGQSEASQFGINLASLRASVKDFVAMARNVRGFLTSAIYDSFNGESVKGVMDKIMTEFRGQFTEAEIQKIVGEKPDLQEMLNRFGVLALADTGGRVYRTVQARLTTKKPKTQKEKQEREIENEAIEQIIQNALALGVTEPPQPPNRKLTPDERLALMTKPATQAKVQKATEDAVKQAEFNAGWAVMMASAAGNEELRAQYQEAMDAKEEPDPEAIEEGLDLPKYAHWRTIRDGFLNYSPTTLKLAQDVIRGRFKGTQFGPKKVAPPAPAKIDLARLVQSPNAEMSRVIGEQLAAIEGVMDLAGASPEAKARVMQMITANVGSQVQLARQRVLNNFLDVKVKAAPIGASERLQRLINAGIIEDPRYKGDKTVELLKRVARKYITTQEFKEIATTDQAQKLPALTAKFNAIVSSENLTDEWMQGAVWTYLTERLQEAEKEITGRFFDLTPKPEPTTAGERLRKLINAGIANDPRYQSEPTRKLLKRVAKTYLTADELSGMATRPRAEKLAFLTGKLNQITAAEKLTDEWMQGAVWTYLTERMMEAENAVVSQIVGAKDVSFDPAQPKTDAQLAADRAKARERLVGGIRAGLLDQRIAESVAKNPALQRLVPKMSDLVKRVLNTPQAGQAKLAQAFSEALLAELAIDQALADKTGVALAKAFEAKFERARIQALDLATKKLTGKQREEAGPGTPLWQKIEQFVNAGGMNSAALLQSIAKKSGWKVPTDEEVSRFRDLARLEQELSTATEEEINAGITDDIKAAMNEGKRMDVMRELQMRWARMTMPIRGNKQNQARALKEYGSANTIFKFGFITKQLIDVATQMFVYTPSRAGATAIQRFVSSRDPNRTLRLWKDIATTLEDAYKARFNALNMAYKSALQAAKGRAEKDTVMGLQSGMRALDRANAEATEYAKSGKYAQAAVLRIAGIAQLAFRFASSLDAFQGVLAEQQEIGAWTESQLRLQGMSQAEARKAAKTIIGDSIAEYALAQTLIGDNPNIAPKDRSAAAWNVVRARQYQRIATAGLDAGDIKGITQNLRSTIGWNVEEEGGPGGVIGQAMKSTGKILSRVGIPDLLGMFSNAVAIGVNRGFTFAGGGFVPSAFEGSAWYKTETDKVQRKIEAAAGLGLSGLFVGLVLSGALRVFTHWPDDKEEADLWEREGHKPNTMELDLPGGKILRVSLSTGPFQFVRPALAAVGELQYQQARRDRLNQKAGAAAKKKGLKFEPRELTAMDIVSALGYGAWSAIAQGRTTSGLIGAGTYRGTADVGKIAAAAVSPLIPFGPLMREATAMSGAQFNPKDQTFINLLVPTPWSGKVDRNFLGDPVGTPRAQERIMSILTGGTAIVGGEDPDRAYQVLAKTGWTPATPQSNKFFQFGRVQRQATPEELTRMQEVRAVELKTRISQLDPATATKRQLDRIEDIANAKSKKAVGIR